MKITKLHHGENVRVIDNGYAADCPICRKTNKTFYDTEALLGKRGALIWYVNDQIGEWCEHSAGVYSAGGRSVDFHFNK